MWLGSGRIEVLFVLEFSYLGRSFGEMVTGISEVNEGGGEEMDGELVEIWRKWFTMICFGWYT